MPEGSIDPPHFYYSWKEIIATLQAHGREVPAQFAINHAYPRIGADFTPLPVPRAVPTPTSCLNTVKDNAAASSSTQVMLPPGVEQMCMGAPASTDATSAGQGKKTLARYVYLLRIF